MPKLLHSRNNFWTIPILPIATKVNKDGFPLKKTGFFSKRIQSITRYHVLSVKKYVFKSTNRYCFLTQWLIKASILIKSVQSWCQIYLKNHFLCSFHANNCITLRSFKAHSLLNIFCLWKKRTNSDEDMSRFLIFKFISGWEIHSYWRHRLFPHLAHVLDLTKDVIERDVSVS